MSFNLVAAGNEVLDQKPPIATCLHSTNVRGCCVANNYSRICDNRAGCIRDGTRQSCLGRLREDRATRSGVVRWNTSCVCVPRCKGPSWARGRSQIDFDGASLPLRWDCLPVHSVIIAEEKCVVGVNRKSLICCRDDRQRRKPAG